MEQLARRREGEPLAAGGLQLLVLLSELKNSAIKFRIGNRKEEERKWDRKSD